MQTPEAQAQEPSALLQPDDAGFPSSNATQSVVSTSQQSDAPAIAGAQLHAVGSIADISANWSAKVVVASTAQVKNDKIMKRNKLLSTPQQSHCLLQADKTKMAAVYDSMAATFVTEGLNLAAVTAIRQFYSLEAQPEPLFYEHFPTPLQPGAVRLVVFRPVQEDPLIQLAHSACKSILGSLPSGILLCLHLACLQ